MTKKRMKLHLTDYEKRMILGLIGHTQLNDQEIVSIFSHLSRNINHRVVSQARKKIHNDFQNIQAVNKSEVDGFLLKYKKFENEFKANGLLPKEEFFDLLRRSKEAMKNAVSIYNNPNISWKAESFIVNAIIAWTYLLHAYFIKNKIDYTYKDKNGNSKKIDDRPKLWELNTCIDKVTPDDLSEPIQQNLKYLIKIRNQIEHSSTEETEGIDALLAAKMQACALNYNKKIIDYFGKEHSIHECLAFSIQFSQISITNNQEVIGNKGLPNIIELANQAIQQDLSDEIFNDPEYAYRVHLVPKTTNNKNKADQIATYSDIGSDIEMAIREVEKPKYSATDIVKMMKEEGYTNFQVLGHNSFVDIWKAGRLKDTKKGYGVEISRSWYWYDKMVDHVRKVLQEQKSLQSLNKPRN